MKKFGYIILLLFLTADLHSQNQTIYPVQLPDQNFFGGKVNCIFQDKTGFLWIGKDSGLFRYDGNEMKSYVHDGSNPTSIGGNVIMSIVEDDNGDLLIGTKGFGLDKYQRSTGKFLHFVHDPSDSKSISFNEVHTIKPDNKGNFWIGTDGGGLNFFEPKKNKFTTHKYSQINLNGLQSNSILCLTDAGNSKYWVGTFNGGLHLFDSKSRKFKQIGKGTSYAKLNIFAIVEVSEGVLWLATWRQGLVSYDVKLDKFSTVIDAAIAPKFRDLKKTDKGEVWASSNRYLFYFSSPTANHRIVKISDNDFSDIYQIFIDYSKTIWFGSENGTLSKLNLLANKFSTIPNTYPFFNRFPYTILADNKRESIYFASKNQIFELTPKSNECKVFNSNFEDIVALAKMSNENLMLVASSFELGIFNKQRGEFSKIEFDKKSQAIIGGKQIKSITTTDNALTYWLGTDPDAIKIAYSEKTKLWKVMDVIYSGDGKDIHKSHGITSYLFDNKDNFLIGTIGGGLNVRKKGQKEFVHFLNDKNNDKSISDNNITCMLKDSKNRVLIGTNAGLNIYDPMQSAFKVYSTKEGLPNSEIKALIMDKKKTVWLSSQKGISSISSKDMKIHNYDYFDGLPSDNFLPKSAAIDASGNLYFGSRGGLVWFNPEKIKFNPIVPEPVLVGFKINDLEVPITDYHPLKKSIELTDDIHLTYGQSSFSLKMAALKSYVNPKKNKIKYKLLGFDANWMMAGSDQTAIYSQIPAGDYTFMFMVSNEDGLWNTNAKKITITIGRPPWLSAWAFVIYFSILMGAALYYLFISNRLKTISILSQINPKKYGKGSHSDLVEPSSIEIDSVDKKFIDKAISIVEENLSNSNFGVDMLCEKMFLGQRQLYRRINGISGLTVSEFIKEIRLKRAAQLLSNKSGSISEIAYQVGFNDPKYFSKCFKAYYGIPPAQYSKEEV